MLLWSFLAEFTYSFAGGATGFPVEVMFVDFAISQHVHSSSLLFVISLIESALMTKREWFVPISMSPLRQPHRSEILTRAISIFRSRATVQDISKTWKSITSKIFERKMADSDEDAIPRDGPSAEEVDLSDETQDFRFLSSLS